jgi:uncharacterized protein (TIGR03790 family)
LCQTLLTDRARVGDDDSQAAFDSELSLVLWPSYPLSGSQLNPMRAYPYALPKTYKQSDYDQPPLMVARLDGPTYEIARSLVDRAMAAERMVLQGRAYIDARGIHDEVNRVGSFGYYDESLRTTAALLKTNTSLQVVLDNRKELFGVGQCPNTVLYCGWYSLRNYLDSFSYQVGAVGYHIASFEAETLRPGTPDSNVWCKRMLEKGITATLGAVAEPYLHSFPRPDLFFGDLVSGKYCLVECFYRTKPYNSWMLTLIGDPLYRPKFQP